MSGNGPATLTQPRHQQAEEHPSLAQTQGVSVDRQAAFAAKPQVAPAATEQALSKGQVLNYNLSQSNDLANYIISTSSSPLKYPEMDKAGEPQMIHRLQELLIACGYLPATPKPDGHYREGTARAVAKAQKELNVRDRPEEGKEAAQQTFAALIAKALESKKLEFDYQPTHQNWKDAVALLKALANPTPGEMVRDVRTAQGETNADTMARIAATQSILIRLGYDLGPTGADGVAGQKLTTALHDFMDKHGQKAWHHHAGSGTIRELLKASLLPPP